MSRLDDRLAAAAAALGALEPGDLFDMAIPAAIVASGLHLAALPTSFGGDGVGFTDTVRILSSLGAIDGATALGFAMHLHVTGAAAQSDVWPPALRERLFRAVVDEGVLVNAASTEEGGGSPSRGAIPGTLATLDDASGMWRLTGEKTWTTWLPALRFALVSARVAGPADKTDSPEVANFLVDLELPGVERLAGFEAMGMRGSARSSPGRPSGSSERPEGSRPKRSRTWRLVRHLDRRGVPRSGGGRAWIGRTLGARSPSRGRFDRRRGHPHHPAPARTHGRGASLGPDRARGCGSPVGRDDDGRRTPYP